MIKLWIDDVRPSPQGWFWVKTYSEAILFIKTGKISEISFDHDLGDVSEKTGYDIAVEIEKLSQSGNIMPMRWFVHSANPVGRQKIISAMRSAEHFWNLNGAEDD
jgi:hypothetical protein